MFTTITQLAVSAKKVCHKDLWWGITLLSKFCPFSFNLQYIILSAAAKGAFLWPFTEQSMETYQHSAHFNGSMLVGAVLNIQPSHSLFPSLCRWLPLHFMISASSLFFLFFFSSFLKTQNVITATSCLSNKIIKTKAVWWCSEVAWDHGIC